MRKRGRFHTLTIFAFFLLLIVSAQPTAMAAPVNAPPVDFFQIDNGSSNFIDTNPDTDSDSISGAPPAGVCTLRDAIEVFNSATTTLGAQGNGCNLSNPSGTLPVPPVYVINLPAYTYTLNNPPVPPNLPTNDRLNIFNPNDDALFLVGMTPATTIVEAGAGPPGSANAADNRVFDINGGVVEFSNMTIRHGFCQNFCANAFTVGGGIWNNRKIVTLDNVVVTDNFADDRGGGIYNEPGGTLNIINGSVITNNSVGRPGFSFGEGGGIYSVGNNFFSSTVLIDNSTVSNNTVTDEGGGIYNIGNSTLTIQNGSLIDGNTADGNNAQGGGIYNSQGSVTIDNSTVSNNLAHDGGAGIFNQGGGIFNTFGGVVNIINGSVIGGGGNGNISGEGSGIFNHGLADSQVIIDNSTVSFNGVDASNRSRFGGGIYNQGIATIQNNSFIVNNTVEQFDGGGILNEIGQSGSGIMTITDSAIDNNSTGFVSFVGGGGIFNRNGGTLNITNSSVDGNSSNIGGGITNSGNGSTVTVDSTTVSGNAAISASGGGIHNLGGAVITIQNGSTVGGATPNTAGFSGGGIFNRDAGSRVIITDSAVDNNTADFQGGGIYNGGSNEGSEVQITNSSVNGNTANVALASGGGGGIFNDGVGSLITINNSTVDNNNATGADGGGIHNEDNGTVIIENGSSVSGNTAADNGGGINNATGFAPTRPVVTTLTIIDSTVVNNTAGANGGGIFNDAQFDTTGNVTITNSVIGSAAQPNTAVEGGGIFNDAASSSGFGNIVIEAGSVIEGNIANGANGGGAISNFADFDGNATVTIDNSVVMDNQATGGTGGAIRNFATSGAFSDIIVNNGSTIQNNTAAQQGGAIFNDANFEFSRGGTARVTIDDTLIGGNTAGTDGGAVYNTLTDSQATATTTITNSRLLVNAATNGGGVFHNDGTTSVTRSCLVDNGEGFRNATTITQDAQRNWWGTFDGPSDADGLSGATGSGDGVTQFVNFNNFRTAPILNCPLSNIPFYTSVPVPSSTIILRTRPNQLIAGSIVVTNLGGAQLDLTAIGLGGGVPELTLLATAPVNIASTESFTIDFECLSATTGTFTDTLTVIHNGANSPATYTIECRVRQNQTAGVEVVEPDIDETIVTAFDPAISKIGFLLPGQLGVTGEQIEWVVTVSNIGSAPGSNIVVTDTLRDELRIDSVDAPDNANVNINGQTVTVTFPVINPGEIFNFSIFTTVLESPNDGLINNEACVSGGGAAEKCTVANSPVGELPATGETPFWRWPLLFLLASLVAAIGLIVMVEVRQDRQ